jgi:hypothetical protein
MSAITSPCRRVINSCVAANGSPTPRLALICGGGARGPPRRGDNGKSADPVRDFNAAVQDDLNLEISGAGCAGLNALVDVVSTPMPWMYPFGGVAHEALRS